MIGMYVLVALISQFASGDFLNVTAWQPTTVEAAFMQLDHKYLGTPVTYRGLQIGEVSRVRSASSQTVIAALELSPLHKRKLPESLVAVATSIADPEGQGRLPAIELVPSAENLESKSAIPGCSSFSAYWSNTCRPNKSVQ